MATKPESISRQQRAFFHRGVIDGQFFLTALAAQENLAADILQATDFRLISGFRAKLPVLRHPQTGWKSVDQHNAD